MKHHMQKNSFASRILMLINGGSASAFAQKCGISEGSIRQYLAGTIPRLDKALALARASGVSLEWLATGQEAPSAVDAAPIDEDLLRRIIEHVLEPRSTGEDHPSPATIAQITTDIYAAITALELRTPPEQLTAIRVATRLHQRVGAQLHPD